MRGGGELEQQQPNGLWLLERREMTGSGNCLLAGAREIRGELRSDEVEVAHVVLARRDQDRHVEPLERVGI
ncbi:MAG: hypothetical protein JWM60_1811, partial [Solirubrobacterales bacterium]|nr:hypothetical protein [Solirubrobacterales bacterium]